MNKHYFLLVVGCSLTGKSKTVSEKREELVIAGEEDHTCSSSNLNAFKLLWDCMLSIWVPAVNSENFICLLTF